MKILITGDWHLTRQTPENRRDDFFQSQVEKVNWIFKQFHRHPCDIMLQPGDLFDSHKAPDYLKRFWINKMREYSTFGDQVPTVLFTVYGQHDLRYHGADKDNTPLGVLDAAQSIIILNKEPIYFGDISFYGSSWGEDIPEIVDKNGTCNRHIWVCHRMVVDEKLWDSQVEYELANPLVRRTGFNLIVSGDNHKSFHVKDKDGKMRLINCGSLMRSKIDQKDHKPCIYIYDTETEKAEQFFIPVKPFEEVMDVAKAEKEKEKNMELETFIESLKGDVEIEGVDFKRNLANHISKNNVSSDIKNMINIMMGG